MTIKELQDNPEVEMCACAHMRALHNYGLTAQGRCRGRYTSDPRNPLSTAPVDCTCIEFRGTGLRLKNSLITLHSSVDAAAAPSPSQKISCCLKSPGSGRICERGVMSCEIHHDQYQPAPPQNITGLTGLTGLQEQTAISTPQTWVTGYDSILTYAGISRESQRSQASGESSRQQQQAMLDPFAYGGIRGASGVPCPNCGAHGPHICPDADALRWAAQDELNAANARAIRELQQHKGIEPSAQEAAWKLENRMQSQRQELRDDLSALAAVVTGINKRLNNTPKSAELEAAQGIEQKWAELQRTLNKRFQNMQDNVNAVLTTWMSNAESKYITADGVRAFEAVTVSAIDSSKAAADAVLQLKLGVAEMRKRIDAIEAPLVATCARVIGSDVPTAAAPSSPVNVADNRADGGAPYTADAALCIRLDEYERRLNAIGSKQALPTAAKQQRQPQDGWVVCAACHTLITCDCLVPPTMPASAAAGWIACADRMPLLGEDVLIAHDGMVFIAARIYTGQQWRTPEGTLLDAGYGWWRPLPAPPAPTSTPAI